MYDADYEAFLQEQNDRAIGAYVRGKYGPKDYDEVSGVAAKSWETKDSGEKAKYADGMVRDSSAGKPQFALIFPKGIPYPKQLLTRVADLYHRGAVKYGDRNWEKSCTEDSLAHHEDAFMRHVVKFLLGEEDEDHAAAVVWNVNAILLTRHNIQVKELKDSLDKIKADAAAAPETIASLPDRIMKSIDDARENGVSRSRPAVYCNSDGDNNLTFDSGDELLDKNNDWWRFLGGGVWSRTNTQNTAQGNLKWLIAGYGPLYIQTGAYAGLTILKDGSFRWE